MEFLSNKNLRSGPMPSSWLHHEAAAQLIAQCPLYEPTGIRQLPKLAKRLGLKNIVVKIENRRMGLTSFKALGGAYAIIRFLAGAYETQTGTPFDASAFSSSAFRNIASRHVFTAATDGNHGLSVAAGARAVGARAVIFVHQHVPEYRMARLRAKGAEVVQVPGIFDDAVAEAKRQARANGWILIADTADEVDAELPRLVLEGYTVLAEEMVSQAGSLPTHAFLHSGVGGLAAACADRWKRLAPEPAFIIVEPEEAPALFESLRHGSIRTVPATRQGNMEMLECYRPSRLAWEILQPLFTACLTVSSEDAAEAVKELASLDIRTTPSGAAALAGVFTAAHDAAARKACGLTEESVVWLVISEGPAE